MNRREIDLARRELRVLDSPVPMGGRAFEIIEVLAQSAGKLVTKDELIKRIWPGHALEIARVSALSWNSAPP